MLNHIDKKLADSFVASVYQVRDTIDFEQMAQYIEQGKIDLAVNMVSKELVMDGFAGFAQTLTDSFIKAGKLNADIASPITTTAGLTLNVTFDVVNPALSTVFASYQANLITNITRDLQESIQGVLQQNIFAGVNPKEQARQITTDLKDSFGLTPRQEDAVSRFRQMLEDKPIEAMSRNLRDRRFDSTILNAARRESSLKPEQIDRMVERYNERYLRYRATTIARTESTRILNMANDELWHEMADKGQVDAQEVKRFWLATNDDRTREWHANIDELNPEGVGLDEPFETDLGPLFFPGDPNGEPANTINCRCYVFVSVVG